MRCSQLTQWVIMVSLTACTSDPVRPVSGFGPGSGTGTGGQAGNHPATDAMAFADSATGAGGAGGSLVGDGAVDSRNARPDVVVRQDDAGAAVCSNDRAPVGSSTLVAAGVTPAGFAAAFNAELMQLVTPGPFLLILSGVNAGSAAPKTAAFGALVVTPSGADFERAPATVPFSWGGSGVVKVAKSDASFELRFVAPSAAMIPVASVELTGTLENACSSLIISSLKMLVPATAGAMAFHGSTVGALMGTPTASAQGGSNNAWPLELSGEVKAIYAALNEDTDAGEGL
jgi:hypothetical protein